MRWKTSTRIWRALADEASSLFTNDNRAMECREKADLLWAQLVDTGHEELLDEVISINRQALALCPKVHPNYPIYCGNLANSLWTNYCCTKEEALLVEAIELQRHANALYPERYPALAHGFENLANYLWAQFQLTEPKDENLLNETISLNRKLLTLCPEGHPKCALYCANLANSLWARHRRTGDELSLDQSIDVQRRVVSMRPVGHADRALSCEILANYLWAKFKLNNVHDENILDEVIHLNREALTLLPETHPKHVTYCENLANVLWFRHCRNRDEHLSLLDEVIHLNRKAFTLCREAHPNYVTYCENLTTSLRARYDYTQDQLVLSEVIKLQRLMITLRPAEDLNRAMSCGDLAWSLWTHHQLTGEEHLLDEIIDLNREGLAICPEAHLKYASFCGNLASALWMRYNRCGDEHLLNESISLNREAINRRPEGHPDRGISCRNLANSLRAQYYRSGDERVLDEVIDLQQEVIALYPVGHPDWAPALEILANSLRARYNSTRDGLVLDEAITLDCQAILLYAEEDPLCAAALHDLAESLLASSQLTGDNDILDEAIRYGRAALMLRPRGHPDRASSCGSLAMSLHTCFKRSGKKALLDEAIELKREVTTLFSEGHPYRTVALMSLFVSLRTRYEQTRDVGLLDETFDLAQEAVALSLGPSRWLSTTRLCWIQLQQATPLYNIEQAVQLLDQSLQGEPDNTAQLIGEASSLLDILWDRFLQGEHHPSAALMPVYHQLIRFSSLLINPVLDVTSQLKRSRILRRIGSDAFVNAVIAGHWNVGLENLEMAQGIIWAQRLHQRNPQLQHVPKELATELEDSLQAIFRHKAVPSSVTEHSSLPSQDILHKHSLRMYAAIRDIRALPGLGSFMLGETWECLSAVAKDHPVAVLVGARGYFYALVISSGRLCGDSPLKLDVTEEQIQYAPMYGVQRPHRGAPAPNKLDDSERGARILRTEPLHQYLQFLWTKVVKPVLDALHLKPSSPLTKPRLHWCPTGSFTSAPLHAAGIYDGPKSQKRCCADYVASSYTPTLTSLLRAQHGITSLAKQDFAITLLAEKRAQEPLALIPGVVLETRDIEAIANLNDVRIVGHLAGSTTIMRTSETIQGSNIVHLACHGVQDQDDATRSGFCLGDGRLTILELMEMDIKHGFVAFLSACNTARGSEDQPDQAMHLAAAMLFAGFKSVIATMWAISDEDGPNVAKWFYEELFAKEVIDGHAVAHALDNAVGKLRKSGVPSHRWVPFIHMGV